MVALTETLEKVLFFGRLVPVPYEAPSQQPELSTLLAHLAPQGISTDQRRENVFRYLIDLTNAPKGYQEIATLLEESTNPREQAAFITLLHEDGICFGREDQIHLGDIADQLFRGYLLTDVAAASEFYALLKRNNPDTDVEVRGREYRLHYPIAEAPQVIPTIDPIYLEIVHQQEEELKVS